MKVKDYIEDARANAKIKFVDESFAYLESIHEPKEYVCKSDYPQINESAFTLSKGERCFIYSTTAKVIKGGMKLDKKVFGLWDTLKIENKENVIQIPNVNSYTVKLGADEHKISGELHGLSVSFQIDSDKYFRLILPKEDNLNKNHKDYIQSERFRTNDDIHLLGLMEFNCNDKIYHVFDYKRDEKAYLIIDSMSLMQYNEFETASSAILYAVGFITGYMPRNENHIMQADDNDFRLITGCKYTRMDDTILTHMEVVSPILLAEAKKSNLIIGHVDLPAFSNMVTIAFAEKRFRRALKIICEGNAFPLEIRAASYSVALETLKNIIMQANEEKVNPFKTKEDGVSTIEKLVEQVNQVADDKFNNRDVVIKKLQQLNQPTNRDSFKIAFKICGIKLNKSDEEALSLRNDFLHGRLPFEDEPEFRHNQELRFTTYKLHFLLALLIMKGCEFSGYIINSPKLHQLLNPDGKEINEPAFYKI